MAPVKIKRALWTEDQLSRAMKAVSDGSSVRSAAQEFGIPRRTLRNHLLTGTVTKKLGRPSYLTVYQENELCKRIFRLADIGMPITAKILRRSVFSFCEANKIQAPFAHGSAGRKWLKLFLLRHPDVAQRKAQSMNPGRAAKLNKFVVNDYFQKLKEVMTRLDIFDKPQLIFNLDEKGCRLTLHKQQKTFARKRAKRVHLIMQEHGESVSIVSCGNAIGQVIPPMVIFKGVRCNPAWKDNLPSGTAIEMTVKGYMTTATFINWVHHFSQYRPPGNVLLIFDGAKSHLDAGNVEAADNYGITLFCLPSNTTHELQPMDKSVFRPFEAFWDDEVMLFWTTQQHIHDRKITKHDFGKIFTKVWPKAASAANVVAGFKATGIFPYNPNIIPEEAFAPSEITYRAEDNAATATTIAPPECNAVPAPNAPTAQYEDDAAAATTIAPPEDNAAPAPNAPTAQSEDDAAATTTIAPPEGNAAPAPDAPTSHFECNAASSTAPSKRLPKSQAFSSSLNILLPSCSYPIASAYRKNTISSYSTRSSSESTSVSDDISLHDSLSSDLESDEDEFKTTFQDILNTPEIKVKTTISRKKSLNYKAIEVTKSLFEEPGNSGRPKKKISKYSATLKKRATVTLEKGDKNLTGKLRPGNSKNNKKSKINATEQSKESWYCHICDEDRQVDMRLCRQCLQYVHEQCVGLSREDKNIFFLCPDCEN